MTDDSFAAVAARASMVPLLPCSGDEADLDALVAFWSALGLEVTYRQRRPNPFVAFGRGGIQLQYYGMPGWDPEQSHSTCLLAVPDTEPVHEAFATGLRALHGRLPVAGAPRITRPRRRANNAGLSGFSLVDPAGNWVRVTRAPDAPVVAGEGGTTSWASAGGGALARALENAVVLADSHGDVAQARKVLGGAVRRARAADGDPTPAELAPALAYLVELAVRAGEAGSARQVLTELESLAAANGANDDVRSATDEARTLLEDTAD
ncbi:VOC family protein [Krasilnikoviella flava]|uniref:Glyoxalase-like domain-containing protein n=1 Tax=Krasilnikoviella flava TaxID=526729 RepID=A0A1T5KZH6_9MICO|nr:hypothetical protein [Krasilnikoviella flava]SKC69124.1 hypothetical protein SAMN04324258_2708 [Krasilnikoviella flava]